MLFVDDKRRVTFYRWVGGPGGHRERLGDVWMTDGVITFHPALNRWRAVLDARRWDTQTGRHLSPADGEEWFTALADGRIWKLGTSSAYGAPWAVSLDAD